MIASPPASNIPKITRTLEGIFRRQAQEAARQALLALRTGELVDMSAWLPTMVEAVSLFMLRDYQQGMVRGARQLATAYNAEGRPTKTYRSKSLARVVVKQPGNIGVSFNLANPRVLQAVDAATMHFCQETNDTATTDLNTAIAQLRAALKAGLPAGEAHALLVKRVQQIFADPKRAARIAFTESLRALQAGESASYVESGVVSKRRWVASSDACPACLALADKEVGLDEPFYIDPKGGPYAIVYHPPLHPWCQCSVNPVLGKPERATIAPTALYRQEPVTITFPSTVPLVAPPRQSLIREPENYARPDAAPYVEAAMKDLEQQHGIPPAEPGSFQYAAMTASISAVLNLLNKDPKQLDVESLADKIHRGWSHAAQTFPNQSPEKKTDRLVLAATPFVALSPEEKKKDKIAARSVVRTWMGPEQYWGNPIIQPFQHPGVNPVADSVVTRIGPNGRKQVLLRRQGNGWALPGGLQLTNAPIGSPWRGGKETAQKRATRELAALGLSTAGLSNLKEVGTFDAPDRDARNNDEARAVSTAMKVNLPKAYAEPLLIGDAAWVDVSELPELQLGFDHRRILMDAGVR